MTGLAWDGICAGYAAGEVLHRVSIELEPGQRLAVLGTNGAGKSTLLRVAAGLVRPAAGAIRMGGADVTSTPADARARAGMALAAGAETTFDHLDVRQSLLLASGHSTYTEPMGGACPEGGFPELMDRLRTRVAALSTGERQLLGLTQALLRRPRILLVDELSRALSNEARERAVEAILGASRRGATVVIVDQSVDLALSLVDRAVFLEAGRIAFDGPPAQLRERGDLLRPLFLR